MRLYLEDLNECHLCIASPAVEDKGPNNNTILLMKYAIKTSHGISGVRFLKNIINTTVIEVAYIYMMN